ncbi:MAG: 3'(2'),5'-bisphosphate nucleotidase CysQ [Pseudomonadota bacterium]
MLAPALLMPKIVAISELAGAAIMKIYASGTTVETKADNSPVTEADRVGEEIILAALRELTPEIPIVAEESAAAGDVPDVGDKPFWLVDPLDGTKEFISRNGEFTVNIALIENRQPLLGVVFAPAIETMWWGAQGHGASRRVGDKVEAIQTRPAPAAGGVAVASRSHRDDKTNAWLQEKGIEETIAAGSSLKFCVVAEGRADYYPRFGPTMEWDVAAGHAVLRAAGGRVTTLEDDPFIYTKPEFRNAGFIAYGA